MCEKAAWWSAITPAELLDLRDRVHRSLAGRFGAALGPGLEDAVQKGLVALLQRREAVAAEDDGLYRFTLTAARNAALDQLRRRATERGHRAVCSTRIDASIPESAADQQESVQKITQILCELDEVERLVLWRHVVEGHSIRQLALDLDLNWHRVAGMLERTLRVLRGKLER